MQSYKATELGSLVLKAGLSGKKTIYQPLSSTERGRMLDQEVAKGIPLALRGLNDAARARKMFLVTSGGMVSYGRGRSLFSSRMLKSSSTVRSWRAPWNYRNPPSPPSVANGEGLKPGARLNDPQSVICFDGIPSFTNVLGSVANPDGVKLFSKRAIERSYPGGVIVSLDVATWTHGSGEVVAGRSSELRDVCKVTFDSGAAAGRAMVPVFFRVQAWDSGNSQAPHYYHVYCVVDMSDAIPGVVRFDSTTGGNTGPHSWTELAGPVRLWVPMLDPRVHAAITGDGITSGQEEGLPLFGASATQKAGLNVVQCFIPGAPSWVDNWHIGGLVSYETSPLKVTVDDSDGWWSLYPSEVLGALTREADGTSSIPPNMWAMHGVFAATKQFHSDPLSKMPKLEKASASEREEFAATVVMEETDVRKTLGDLAKFASGRRYREVAALLPAPDADTDAIPDVVADVGSVTFTNCTEGEWLSAYAFALPYTIRGTAGLTAAQLAKQLNDGVDVEVTPAAAYESGEYDTRFWLTRSDLGPVTDQTVMVGLSTLGVENAPLIDVLRGPMANGMLEERMFAPV